MSVDNFFKDCCLFWLCLSLKFWRYLFFPMPLYNFPNAVQLLSPQVSLLSKTFRKKEKKLFLLNLAKPFFFFFFFHFAGKFLWRMRWEHNHSALRLLPSGPLLEYVFQITEWWGLERTSGGLPVHPLLMQVCSLEYTAQQSVQGGSWASPLTRGWAVWAESCSWTFAVFGDC